MKNLTLPTDKMADLTAVKTDKVSAMPQPAWIHGDVETDAVLWNDLKGHWEYNNGQYYDPKRVQMEP